MKKLKLVKNEAASAPVTLRIENGRVKGFTYPMMKALVDSGNVSVFSDSTGPFGEDEGAEVISTTPDKARGVRDRGDGDEERAADCDTLVVFNRENGQSGTNWGGFDEDEGNEGENIYIAVVELPKAVEIWRARNFV